MWQFKQTTEDTYVNGSPMAGHCDCALRSALHATYLIFYLRFPQHLSEANFFTFGLVASCLQEMSCEKQWRLLKEAKADFF